MLLRIPLIPAKAGIQRHLYGSTFSLWVPAFAGTSGVEVMDKALFRSVLPYAVGLAIAVALYLYAGTIVYAPRPGQLGPETWPRLAILLM
ncbi:MAG TPA: hypothetical protein VFO74_10240, partial [Pseudolabrys sp.]|nr:hypothetical protein [Pseudolabrys sp.]